MYIMHKSKGLQGAIMIIDYIYTVLRDLILV